MTDLGGCKKGAYLNHTAQRIVPYGSSRACRILLASGDGLLEEEQLLSISKKRIRSWK